MMGKAISAIEETATEPFIEFSSEESSAFGNSGCNNFSGTFSLDAGNKIKIGPLAGTRKACMNAMGIEKQFLEILSSVDTYTINNEILSFSKSKTAPLLVFEATTE